MKRTRSEEGFVAIDFVIVAPMVLAGILLIAAAGTIARANSTVDAAAYAAARAASISRSSSDAQSQARSVANSTLSSRGLQCSPTSLSVDTSGFSVPVGQPAAVTVDLTCTVPLSHLVVPGLPGSKTVRASAVSVIDTYRGRS